MDETPRPDDESTTSEPPVPPVPPEPPAPPPEPPVPPGPPDPPPPPAPPVPDADTGDDAGGGDAAGPSEATATGSAARFTRRQVLAMAGATGLLGTGAVAYWLTRDEAEVSGDPTANRSATTSTTAPATTTTAPAETDPAMARWSDPATWGGRVPGDGDVAVLDKPVLLDTDPTVAGVRVEPAGELVFDPAASHTLTSTGNVIVAGALRARPHGPEVQHLVKFAGIDEGRVEGGHTMAPVDTDVGLWVVGDGVFDVAGTPKRAWTNLTGAAEAGASTIEVADAGGWQVGDEVVVTPTEPTTVEGYAEHFDRRTVAAVRGSTVELDEPLSFPHPAVNVRPGITHHAEVLNLTRNVRVEGEPEGRAHVILVGVTGKQAVSYLGLRHLGPQKPAPEGGIMGAVGRYSLHFHTSLDATQGSLVEGVVSYDGGNHAFVPHLSHGITFRDCIAHDQAESAYWWDPPYEESDEEENERVPANDLVYDRCVASLVRPTDETEYSTTGFVLGPGQRNVARGCVAVGMQADDSATPGFGWRGDAHEAHAWVFEDCLGHDNYGSSLYFWVNGVPHSYVDRFTSYHDGSGMHAGAYTNLVSYRDCTVYACATVGLVIEAVPGVAESAPDVTVTYENMYVDQAGLSEFAVVVGEHVSEPDALTKLSGCQFMGGTTAQVGFTETGPYGQLYEFTDCTFDGNAFWLVDDLTERVDIRVRDSENGAISLLPAGRGGTGRDEWNASVSAL
jgi:hypothetical protein